MKAILDVFQLIRWWKEESATALMESVILFPVMITLLAGCFDIGQGIILNQKTIGASQIIGDLIGRQRSVTMAMMTDIIEAGKLAYEPYVTTTFGYDIVSVQFDSSGNPKVLWRITKNATKNDTAVNSTKGLGDAGEGVIVVTTVYKYTPYFVNSVISPIDMKEVAFLRGRRTAVVTCTDCPAS